MEKKIKCYVCENEADFECKECGKPICDKCTIKKNNEKTCENCWYYEYFT